MQHQWFSNLPKQDQQERKNLVLNSEKILDILHQMVYNMSIVESRTSSSDYDSPNWAYRQAHQNGKLEAYTEVLNLLTVSDKDAIK
jgi:hypothetical protein